MNKNNFKEYLHENKNVFEQNAYYGALGISGILNFGFVNMRKSYNKLKKNTRYGIMNATESHNKPEKMYRSVILGLNDDDCGIVIKNYDKTVYAVYNGNEFIYKAIGEKYPIIHKGSLTDICNFILKGFI